MCRWTFDYGDVTFNCDLSSGTLTISVKNSTKDYICDIDDISCYDQEINFPRSSFEKVIIENGITHIGIATFEYFTNLKSVTIPQTIRKIADRAFLGCFELKNVTILEGVTYIGAGAFCDCKRLTEIKIPESVKTIGNAVFSGCTGLKTIHYKAGAKFTNKLIKGNDAALIVY